MIEAKRNEMNEATMTREMARGLSWARRKLCSRKFWAAIASFTAMLMVYRGREAGEAEQVTALIMAGASVVAYILGEGFADAAHAGADDA